MILIAGKILSRHHSAADICRRCRNTGRDHEEDIRRRMDGICNHEINAGASGNIGNLMRVGNNRCYPVRQNQSAKLGRR